MIIRALELHGAASVHDFLRANGWAHRIGSQDDYFQLITASQRKAVEINPSGHVVGFACGTRMASQTEPPREFGRLFGLIHATCPTLHAGSAVPAPVSRCHSSALRLD